MLYLDLPVGFLSGLALSPLLKMANSHWFEATPTPPRLKLWLPTKADGKFPDEGKAPCVQRKISWEGISGPLRCEAASNRLRLT
jgi:hypothetical protein